MFSSSWWILPEQQSIYRNNPKGEDDCSRVTIAINQRLCTPVNKRKWARLARGTCQSSGEVPPKTAERQGATSGLGVHRMTSANFKAVQVSLSGIFLINFTRYFTIKNHLTTGYVYLLSSQSASEIWSSVERGQGMGYNEGRVVKQKLKAFENGDLKIWLTLQ